MPLRPYSAFMGAKCEDECKKHLLSAEIGGLRRCFKVYSDTFQELKKTKAKILTGEENVHAILHQIIKAVNGSHHKRMEMSLDELEMLAGIMNDLNDAIHNRGDFQQQVQSRIETIEKNPAGYPHLLHGDWKAPVVKGVGAAVLAGAGVATFWKQSSALPEGASLSVTDMVLPLTLGITGAALALSANKKSPCLVVSVKRLMLALAAVEVPALLPQPEEKQVQEEEKEKAEIGEVSAPPYVANDAEHTPSTCPSSRPGPG